MRADGPIESRCVSVRLSQNGYGEVVQQLHFRDLKDARQSSEESARPSRGFPEAAKRPAGCS